MVKLKCVLIRCNELVFALNEHQYNVREIAKKAFEEYVYCIAVHLVIT
jgi:hypothetical protein